MKENNLFFRDNECCVIKYKNGRWYRTYCVEVLFDGFATMHFIDFGNMRPIEISDIRPIPEALLFESVTITADCFSDCKSIINVLGMLVKTYAAQTHSY